MTRSKSVRAARRARSLCALLAAIPCAALAAAAAPDDEASLVHAFRAGRVVEIAGEDGWLTVVGLHWFKPGANSFGRSPLNRMKYTSPS